MAIKDAFKDMYAAVGAQDKTRYTTETDRDGKPLYAKKDGTGYVQAHRAVDAALDEWLRSQTGGTSTPKDVQLLKKISIAKDYTANKSAEAVAKQYGVSESTVYRAAKYVKDNFPLRLVKESKAGTTANVSRLEDAVASADALADTGTYGRKVSTKRNGVYNATETPAAGDQSGTPQPAPQQGQQQAPSIIPAGPRSSSSRHAFESNPQAPGVKKPETPAAEEPIVATPEPEQPVAPSAATPAEGTPIVQAPQPTPAAVPEVNTPADAYIPNAPAQQAAPAEQAPAAAPPVAEQPNEDAAEPSESSFTIIGGEPVDPVNHPNMTGVRVTSPRRVQAAAEEATRREADAPWYQRAYTSAANYVKKNTQAVVIGAVMLAAGLGIGRMTAPDYSTEAAALRGDVAKAQRATAEANDRYTALEQRLAALEVKPITQLAVTAVPYQEPAVRPPRPPEEVADAKPVKPVYVAPVPVEKTPFKIEQKPAEVKPFQRPTKPVYTSPAKPAEQPVKPVQKPVQPTYTAPQADVNVDPARVAATQDAAAKLERARQVEAARSDLGDLAKMLELQKKLDSTPGMSNAAQYSAFAKTLDAYQTLIKKMQAAHPDEGWSLDRARGYQARLEHAFPVARPANLYEQDPALDAPSVNKVKPQAKAPAASSTPVVKPAQQAATPVAQPVPVQSASAAQTPVAQTPAAATGAPAYTGQSGNAASTELKTVKVANPGKGKNITPYWSDFNEDNGMSKAQKHEAAIQNLIKAREKATGKKIVGTTEEGTIRVDYWTSLRNYGSSVFFGHGDAAEANAAVYTNTEAKLRTAVKNGEMSQAQADSTLDDVICTVGNKENESDIRNDEKEVRRYNSADATLDLKLWKSTASISRLLTEKPSDVYKSLEGSTLKGATQVQAIARSFDAQKYVAAAEMQLNQLEADTKAKRSVDKTTLFSCLTNAVLADKIGTDKPVDGHMQDIMSKALKIAGAKDKDIKKAVETEAQKKIKTEYGKELPGETNQDIFRAVYDMFAQIVPGVTLRGTDFRRGTDMPEVSDFEKLGSSVYTPQTLSDLVKMGDKFPVLNYDATRELTRVYGYAMAMHADKIVRDSNGKPNLRNAIKAGTELEKAELVMGVIDESRGNGKKLLGAVRGVWNNEMHDKYGIDRMFLMELAERELMTDLAAGKSIVKSQKDMNGYSIMNELKKLATWAAIGASAAGGAGSGHAHHVPNHGGPTGGQAGGNVTTQTPTTTTTGGATGGQAGGNVTTPTH